MTPTTVSPSETAMMTCTMVVYLISSVSNHGYWMPVGEVYETRAECEHAIEKSGDQYKPHGAAKRWYY